jgi:glycosyltransferase involved in cell wall biosynthesis
MLDVIIPVHNDANRVCRAIGSVESALGLQNVIVIDDGSTDNSREVILNKWQNIRLTTISNSGPSVARNVGIELSTAKYLLFLDSDDEIIVNNFTKVMCKIAFDNSDFYYYNHDTKPLQSTIRYTNSVAISDIVVRRELVTSIGMFDQNLWQHEDWDLWSRCIAESPTLERLEKQLSTIHVSPFSNSSNYLNMAITNMEVLRRNVSRFQYDDGEINMMEIFDNRFKHLFHDIRNTPPQHLSRIRRFYLQYVLRCTTRFMYNKIKLGK